MPVRNLRTFAIALIYTLAAVWMQINGCIPRVALGDSPQLAQRVPFAVPLADGQTGTGLMLDAKQLLVVAPGQPPVLAFFEVNPRSPTPPVPPTPEPLPPKPEPPPPVPVPPGPGVLDILWIEETAARTPEQARALTDRAIRDALAAAGWSLRVVDQDITDETGKTPPDLAPAIAAAKQAGLPYLIVRARNGAEVYAGKAPPDLTAFQALLQRLGLRINDQVDPRQDHATEQATEQTPSQGEKDSCPTGQCPTGNTTGQRQQRVYLFRRR
jgi:hypothetical protein